MLGHLRDNLVYGQEQTVESGIRLALGADRTRIMNLFLRRALKLTLAGTCLGMSGALMVSREMNGLLYAVSSHDL